MNSSEVLAWIRSWPVWIQCLSVFVAGALAALAFAPYYAIPVLFLSFPLLLVLVERAPSWQRAAVIGWFFGFGHFLVGFHWIGNAFLVDADTFGWMEYPAVMLLSAAMALYPALAVGVVHALWRRLEYTGRNALTVQAVLVFALAWNAGEFLRGHLFTGFPWNLTGYIWGVSDTMLQPASVFGIYGLSLITILLVSLPAVWTVHRFPARRGLMALAVFLFIPLMMYGYGAWSLSGASDATVPGVYLRIVQANINQHDKWDPARREDHLIKYLEMSAKPSATPVTDVIWPETAVAYFIGHEPSRRHLISSVLATPHGHVLTGAPRIERKGRDNIRLWNSYYVIGHDGVLLARYDKSHLVPFGEYLPFRSFLAWFGLDALAAGDIDFTPGPGPRTIKVDGLPPFSPMICYEIIFPGNVLDSRNRPQWILNATNDSWFGNSTGPYQHLVAARTRAIEEGMPVVRAAGSGISAVIDSYGRVLKSIGLNKSGIVDSHLPEFRDYLTIFARFGYWSYWILFCILVLGIVVERRAEKG